MRIVHFLIKYEMSISHLGENKKCPVFNISPEFREDS